MSVKKLLILLSIVLLGAVLRFYHVDSNPPSLTWDEVAWGYNAYSLSIDGRDEFGRLLPHDYFESFGDFKPPVYAYLAVPPVMVFGLTEFAVRFPSALFGTLTILLTFFLVRELFYQQKKSHISEHFVDTVAYVSSLLLAISPWHIMLSRAAFEANVASFFIVLGCWLFLLALRKNIWLLNLSIISFIASLYTFNSTRVVAPLLVMVLAIAHYKTLLKHIKAVIVVGVVGLVVVSPTVPFLLSPQAKLRYTEVNIFSDIDVVKQSNQEIANDHNAWWSKIIHNRRVLYAESFTRHYLDNLSPRFLFMSGDENPKFSTQDVGQMYVWEAPFLLIGLLFLFRQRVGKWWFIPLWLLLGIIPAAVARETPHALRTESTLPTWQIMTAYGLVTSFYAFKRFRMLFAGCVSIVAIVFLTYYLHGYYTHYAQEYSAAWQYGYKDAINYVKANQDTYKTVYISNKVERGYVYTLFYLRYDPREYRKEAIIQRDPFGFVHVEGFGKYRFIDDPTKTLDKHNALFITGTDQLPNNITVLKTFPLVDGKVTLEAYTLK